MSWWRNGGWITVAVFAVFFGYMAILCVNDERQAPQQAERTDRCIDRMLDTFTQAADDWAELKGTTVTRIAKGPDSDEPVMLLAEYSHSGHQYEFLGAVYRDPCTLYVKPFGRSWMAW